jgi:hypothetical protein
MDYFKSGLAKAGELAGAATVAAGAFAEEHDLAGKLENAKASAKETYAAKTGRDPDADIAHASEKAGEAAATAVGAAKVAGSVISAKAAEIDEKHGISTKAAQAADGAVAMYDEKTGRSYYQDKESTKEACSEKIGALGAVAGDLGESAKMGYATTAGPSNTTEAIVGEEFGDCEPPPPSYDEVCEMPSWCEPKVFEDCFTVTIATPEQLMETCTNLVQRIDLECDLAQIESACERHDIEKEPILTSDALMHWFCAESQFGTCSQFPQ